MNERDTRDAARHRAAARMGFFIHLAVYVLVNGFLAALNLLRPHDSLWFLWPLGGWGIGIFFHALAVFVLAPRREPVKKG
jgi:hypothetical protein